MSEVEKFTNPKIYKVFISYCWTSPEHEDWVHSLAERLMSNGVDIRYDKWDLKEGQDKFSFMESMIQDETIDKVLIICDKGYKEKADKRKGGVGTETQIITPELYNKVNQTKFIPIIAEQGDSFDSYMPIFIKSRKGIDMSSLATYEDGYEQLLRAIYKKPKYTKPQLGTMPSFLEEGGKKNYKTKNINASLKNCIIKSPDLCSFHIKDFIDEFKNALGEFKINKEDLTQPYDEIIYNKIHEMLPLRDDYVTFIDTVCKFKKLDIDLIIKLFEKLYALTEFQGNGSFIETQFDQYRFFLLEIFLYTVVILLKNEEYSNLNILINAPYFVNYRFGRNDSHSDFTAFRFYVNSLESRNKRLQLSKVSFTAQALIDRSVINGTSYKDELIDADILLYYISYLKTKDAYCSWFPTTYIYKERYDKVDILRRLVSKRHFDKIKILFNVNTEPELKQLMNEFNEEGNRYTKHTNCWDSIPCLKEHINPDDICTTT